MFLLAKTIAIFVVDNWGKDLRPSQLKNLMIMTTERELARAISIASIQTESRVLLKKVLDDLNTLKHQIFFTDELRRDINTAMDLLEKHKEALSYYNVRELIMQEIAANK